MASAQPRRRKNCRTASVPIPNVVNPSLLVIYATDYSGAAISMDSAGPGTPTLPNSGDDESTAVTMFSLPATCGMKATSSPSPKRSAAARVPSVLADNDRERRGILLELINKIPDIGTVLVFTPEAFRHTPHERHQ